MAHLYIIAGHGAGDSGACGNGYQEQERVRALAQRIKDLGGDDVTLHPFADNAYASNAISKLIIPSDWQICELHMDSAAAGARGAHVIINSTFEPDDFDNALADALVAIFPGRSSKIAKRSDLANPKRAAAKGLPYRLIENGFISDATDVGIFNSRIDDIARAYLSAFGLAAAQGSAPAANPAADAATPAADAEGSGFEGGTYRCTVNELRVRTAPSLSGEVVAKYGKGQTVVLDSWYTVADGWVWGRYTGASSGKKRYVAVGKATGKPEADDFLVKA